MSRTIVLTFSSFKGIEQILKVNKQKNGGDCYINQDYSKETSVIATLARADRTPKRVNMLFLCVTQLLGEKTDVLLDAPVK